MLIKTRGIVLKNRKYSETSLICEIYTEEKGLRSYIISGVRSPKAKVKANLLALMSIVDIVAYHQDSKDLNRIKEVKPAYVYQSIPFEVIKGSVGLFMTELLGKGIYEREVNLDLFDFILHHFVLLDQTEGSIGHFHLIFAVHLTRLLGFEPQGICSDAFPFFDCKEGAFVQTEPLHHPHYFNETESKFLYKILQSDSSNYHLIKIPKATRRILVDKILMYYQLHIENFKPMQSHLILREVLD